MDNYKNKVIKFVMSGLAIFAIGLFVGYQFDNMKITTIQGYLFKAVGRASDSNASNSNASNSNASNSNASNSNASNSNASNSNASNSNASNSNASSGNASITDNILYLRNFALGSTSAKPGDKVYVTLSASGANMVSASIVFEDSKGLSFASQLQSLSNKPYIIIPNSAVASTYSVTDVLLVGRNSNNTTFSKQFGKTGDTYNFNSTLTIVANNEEGSKVTLESIKLMSTTAEVGKRVYLDVKTSAQLNSLKMVFTSTDNKSFTVYAKDLTEEEPYIEIPSSTKAGTYTLTSVVISNIKSSTAYSKNGENNTEKFDFNISLEVKDGDGKEYVYNNEDITSEIMTKLYDAPTGSQIIINADSKALIDKELFNTIKGKNKELTINYKGNQIIFNGLDITDSKTIDATMTVDNISSNEDISKLVSDGIIVNFPDNGNLPGKALIRVKSTSEVGKVLKDIVYVYIYNEGSKNFCEVESDVKKTKDNYYEFTITHNSDYVITNEKLSKKLVVDTDEENLIDFQKSTKVYLLLIAIGILAIIAVVVIILIVKNNNKKTVEKKDNKVEEEKPEDKEVSEEKNESEEKEQKSNE